MIPARALKWMALAGELLIMLALGSTYTFGNMNPYFTSYLRERLNDTSIHYSTTAWVNSLGAIGQASAMPLSGFLESKIGTRLTALAGCVIFCTGVFLSAFTVRWSFYAFALTYGLMFGVGTGIAYPICIACSIRWFPANKGTITGVTLLGFGLSSFLFNIVQTAIINPNNLSPDVSVSSDAATEKFFSQSEVLDRVPECFFITAAVFAVMQAAGVLLVNSPKVSGASAQESEPLLSDAEHAPEADGIRNISNSSINGSAKGDERDATPSQMLRSKHFYMLYVIFAVNMLTVNFIGSLYKAFGQTFISNDFYLTAVGSLSSVFNAAGRIAWGFVADRVSNKFALFVICCLGAALLFSLVACTVMPPVLYLVWICLIFFSFAGQFAVCPAAIAKLYGTKHLPTNYGLLFTAGILGAVLSSTLATLLLQSIGWFGLFCICASLYIVGATSAFLFHAESADGREV